MALNRTERNIILKSTRAICGEKMAESSVKKPRAKFARRLSTVRIRAIKGRNVSLCDERPTRNEMSATRNFRAICRTRCTGVNRFCKALERPEVTIKFSTPTGLRLSLAQRNFPILRWKSRYAWRVAGENAKLRETREKRREKRRETSAA